MSEDETEEERWEPKRKASEADKEKLVSSQNTNAPPLSPTPSSGSQKKRSISIFSILRRGTTDDTEKKDKDTKETKEREKEKDALTSSKEKENAQLVTPPSTTATSPAHSPRHSPLTSPLLSPRVASDPPDLPFGLDDDFGLAKEESQPTAAPTTPEPAKRKNIFAAFLKEHTCFDLVPASGKIVVLDTTLPVKSAFFALVENNIKSAPLWDSEKGDYVGMITVTDFIDILRHFHRKPTDKSIRQELEEHQIKTWREIIKISDSPSLLCVTPEHTLFEASRLLLQYRIHRLPIMDRAENNSILHIITHLRILTFLVKNFQEHTSLLRKTIGELGIGTYQRVVTALQGTPLITVLDFLSEGKISAIPIVDEHGIILDVYSKSDIMTLAAKGNFHLLNEPVQEMLPKRAPEEVHTCLLTDVLADVLDRIITKRVHRLIVVDSTRRVIGIISLSDILAFFLKEEEL